MAQLFINVVGHNASGKTTLSNRLAKDLQLNRVSGDDFRHFLFQTETLPYFRDTDSSFPNHRFSLLGDLTDHFRREMIKILLSQNQHVILDGTSYDRKTRRSYMRLAHTQAPDATRVIVWTSIPEQELLERLADRNKVAGDKWLRQYHEIKKHTFQMPDKAEADTLLVYTQGNYEEIRNSIAQLL